jgi:AcrR family transcriptional regulator
MQLARLRRRDEVSKEYEKIALDLFATRGFRNVTVADIADAAGVTPRTIFRYFPTKEDLLLALPRRATKVQLAALAELEPSDDPVGAVWQLFVDLSLRRPSPTAIRRWYRAVNDVPEATARMQGERAALIEDALADYIARSWELDPTADVRPRVLAASLQAAWRAVMDYWSAGGTRLDLDAVFTAAYAGLVGLRDRPAIRRRGA